MPGLVTGIYVFDLKQTTMAGRSPLSLKVR
jgi:hypothetical protein